MADTGIRTGKIVRQTHETDISVDLNIDGKGSVKVETGVGFIWKSEDVS